MQYLSKYTVLVSLRAGSACACAGSEAGGSIMSVEDPFFVVKGYEIIEETI